MPPFSATSRVEVAALTLDVTGTLIHSPRLSEIYAAVLRRHGLDVSDEVVASTIKTVWQEFDCAVESGDDRYGTHPDGARGWWARFLERVCEHLEVPPAGPFAAAELYDRFGKPEAWEIYPDVLPALEELEGLGVRMAVLSNWDPRLTKLLERLGLAGFFEAAVVSAEVGVEKPHPAIFQHALDLLDLPPSLVAHVGDRRGDDVEGAWGVGMEGLLLDREGGGDLDALTELPRRLELVESAPF